MSTIRRSLGGPKPRPVQAILPAVAAEILARAADPTAAVAQMAHGRPHALADRGRVLGADPGHPSAADDRCPLPSIFAINLS